MKLLVQSDDYAISPAVARGILYGIENGIIRNTGMFMNMPWSVECGKLIMPYLDKIALGIDLNLTTGTPLTKPDLIPSLVQDNGAFHTSNESRTLDAKAKNQEHAVLEEVILELENQIKRFVELFGRKPDYVHPHAYATPAIIHAESELAKAYGIPFSLDVFHKIFKLETTLPKMEWYLKPATPENQLKSSLKTYILMHSEELLKKDYSLIVGHMGFVDHNLMKLSSYNLYRISDLEAVTSPEIVKWVEDNQIELISYRNL